MKKSEEEFKILNKDNQIVGYFKDFTGYWSTTDFSKPVLKNINLKIIRGKLYVLVG